MIRNLKSHIVEASKEEGKSQEIHELTEEKVFLKFRYLLSLLVVVTFLVGFDYLYEDYSNFDLAKTQVSEQYLNSDLGNTRYQIFGENNTEVIVLISASNGYIEQWSPNIQPLVNAGYKVVAYDLYGRGLSARPNINLDLSVFRAQLSLIINEVNADQVHLVGSSFGSIIASDYVINNSEKVDKLVLIGPAGWPSGINLSSRLIKIPVLGELIFHYFGYSILNSRVEGYFYDKDSHLSTIKVWQEFARYPGFIRSYLSTLRHSPVLDYIEGWKELGLLDKNVLFIWGKNDISFPFENSHRAIELVPNAKITAIDKAAHWVNIDRPLLVNKSIVSFLKK